MRLLKEEPYSQKEAEAAVGLGTDNARPEKMALSEEVIEQSTSKEAPNHPDSDDEEEYNVFFSAY